jgi:hypothetical protein
MTDLTEREKKVKEGLESVVHEYPSFQDLRNILALFDPPPPPVYILLPWDEFTNQQGPGIIHGSGGLLAISKEGYPPVYRDQYNAIRELTAKPSESKPT